MVSERPERESHILELLAKDGTLSVAALSKDLGVSAVTIRASLKSMEERGLLARTWGGARTTSITDVLERVKVSEAEKERIATAAAALVRDDDRIMIEAGTTTALVVRQLTGRRGVQIVTNSTLVFSYARLNPDLDVILTGGQYHRASETMIGPVATQTIRRFNARIAFVGTDGFTSDRGMTAQFSEGIEVLQAMHERAEETWLLADASKYGRAGFVSVLDLDRLTGLITDSGLSASAREALQNVVPTVLTV